MTTLSFLGGVDAIYSVAAGQTVITISSGSRLDYKAVTTGTGQMHFHWVQEGKTQVWRCDVSMLDSHPVQPIETPGPDGSQSLQVAMGSIYPAGLLLKGRMEGVLFAPAVHVELPWWKNLWVFMIRSPWFPLNLKVDRPSLTVRHNASLVTASLSVSSGGMASGQIGFDGQDYKNATLVLRRTLGPYASEEAVSEATSGVQAFDWKPIERDFDLLLVMGSSISESHLAEISRGLGAEVSSGIFGPGGVQGDFVLCDGPMTSYSWVLRGHRGFLENDEDQTVARFTW